MDRVAARDGRREGKIEMRGVRIGWRCSCESKREGADAQMVCCCYCSCCSCCCGTESESRGQALPLSIRYDTSGEGRRSCYGADPSKHSSEELRTAAESLCKTKTIVNSANVYNNVVDAIAAVEDNVVGAGWLAQPPHPVGERVLALATGAFETGVRCEKRCDDGEGATAGYLESVWRREGESQQQ